MSAQVTPIAQKHMRAIMHFVCVCWTCEDALAAVDAAFSNETELRLGILPFGIVAPEAAHGASLEEHSGANARTIVQRKPLDVEDNVG